MKTEPNSKTVQKTRLLLVLPLMAMAFFVFSCERKEAGSQVLENSENEEIIQVPLNQIPPPRPPLIDDSRRTQGNSTADATYDIVEKPPLPVGGVAGWNKYLASNLKYPTAAREKGIEGMVVVAFLVDREGKITTAEILKGVGGGCDEEALRVINASPDWQPGQQGGKDVNVRIRLPIQFKLADDYKSASMNKVNQYQLEEHELNEEMVVGYSKEKFYSSLLRSSARRPIDQREFAYFQKSLHSN